MLSFSYRLPRKIFALVFLSAFFIVPSYAFNTVINDSPVVNFKIPVFSEKGYRRWYLQGDKGWYKNEETVEVENMSIKVFSGDQISNLESTILSPNATILPKTNKAFGAEDITVTATDYTLEGQVWTWDGNEKKIYINKNVRLTFNQSLQVVLANE